MSSDNFHFDISCAPLDACLDIAFAGSPSRKATHWRVDHMIVPNKPVEQQSPPRLILAWHEAPGYIPLPAPMDAMAAVTFIRAWLKEQNYGPEPDHDGDNGKSWRVYCEDWGHVDHCPYAFVAIEPLWAMYMSEVQKVRSPKRDSGKSVSG